MQAARGQPPGPWPELQGVHWGGVETLFLLATTRIRVSIMHKYIEKDENVLFMDLVCNTYEAYENVDNVSTKNFWSDRHSSIATMSFNIF